VSVYLALLALVSCERGVELVISRRNAAWALRHGGVEYGARHFRWMQVLHASFLVACAAEVVLWARPWHPLLGVPMLVALLAAQALRYWAIATLGRRWTVRVIVLPGEPAVRDGPYRYVRHPNYLAVIVEGIAIPLVHTAWVTAVVFTLLNAVLLTVRIRCEEQALTAHCAYAQRMADRTRFVPRAVGLR
jgi:methyltransferase